MNQPEASQFLAHIDKMKTKRTKELFSYVPVRIGDFNIAALVDSGNLYRTCISLEAANKMNLKLRNAPIRSLGTADKNADLSVIGETAKPIHIRLGEHNTKFKIRPIVIKNLSHPMNISARFLQRFHIDQLHSQNCLSIGKHKVSLISTPFDAIPATCESVYVKAYVTKDVVVPPNSFKPVKLHIPAIKEGRCSAGDGLLRGSDSFQNSTDLHPWLSAHVHAEEDGTLWAEVFNSLDKEKKIKKGQSYGTFTKTCDESEQSKYPWRVCAVPTWNKDAIPVKSKDGKKYTDDEKIEYIKKVFKIEECDMLKTDRDRQKAIDLLKEYFDILSINGECGLTDLIEARIDTGDTAPIKCRTRPVNPVLEQSLKEQVELWKQLGVVESANSPWNFPLTAAKKKNGGTRWCIDLRLLNRALSKSGNDDAFVMPDVQDNLARLAGRKVFSTCDAASAYHSIKIRKEDRHKTAFNTPWEQLQFRRLPFGLARSVPTFNRLIMKIMQGLPMRQILAYMDDALIATDDLDSHFKVLRKMFDAYRRANIRLQPSKCFLFRSQVEYLGHLVSEKGIGTVPSYVDVIKKWPLPATRTQVRSFIGKCQYYRRFIKGFSTITKEWNAVMGKGTPEEEKSPIEVTDTMKQSFELLKRKLTEAPILAFPSFKKEDVFVLDTDWSREHNTIAGVLSQRQGPDKQEKVIAYGSKKLLPSKRRYSSFQGELVSALNFMEHWKYFLQFKKFILRTDHAALKWLHSMKDPDDMTQRWIHTLSKFDFEVQHRSGRVHNNADALSRIDHAELDDVEDDEAEDAVGQVVSAIVKSPFDTETLRDTQNSDETIKTVIKWVLDKHEPDGAELKTCSLETRMYAGLLKDLIVDSRGILCRLRAEDTGDLEWTRSQVVCIPEALQDSLIRHCHVAGGHCGRDRTIEAIREVAFFPQMRSLTDSIVKSCLECQRAHRGQKPQRHTHVSTHDASYPMQRISVDVLGPMPTSDTGMKYALTVLCTFSKWFEAFPIEKANASTIAEVLERQILSRYGLCEVIHTDNGTPFVSRLFKAVGSVLGIKLTTTPPYSPKSNPVERQHRTLGAMLRKLMEQTGQDWAKLIPACVFAMNTAKSRTTGLAPYQVMFGRCPSTPLSVAFGSPPRPPPSGASAAEYALELQKRVKRAFQYARENIHNEIQRQRRIYHDEKHLFEPGQKVYLFHPALAAKAGARKFAIYWHGPYIITEKKSDVLYKIIPSPEMPYLRPEEVVSIDRLRAYTAPNPVNFDDSVGKLDFIEMDHDEFGETVAAPDLPVGHGVDGGAPGGPGGPDPPEPPLDEPPFVPDPEHDPPDGDDVPPGADPQEHPPSDGDDAGAAELPPDHAPELANPPEGAALAADAAEAAPLAGDDAGATANSPPIAQPFGGGRPKRNTQPPDRYTDTDNLDYFRRNHPRRPVPTPRSPSPRARAPTPAPAPAPPPSPTQAAAPPTAPPRGAAAPRGHIVTGRQLARTPPPPPR